MDRTLRRRVTRGIFLAYPAATLTLLGVVAALLLLAHMERTAHPERPATEQGGTR